MFDRHKHNWKETERIVCKPVAITRWDGWGDSNNLERILWGITSIVLTCHCGDKKVVEVKGCDRVKAAVSE